MCAGDFSMGGDDFCGAIGAAATDFCCVDVMVIYVCRVVCMS